eukprot:m.248659 g.248659  ORF g.248659 m.248659 type:complete len:51 (+) comp19507_c2_seq6:2316-2468(+)
MFLFFGNTCICGSQDQVSVRSNQQQPHVYIEVYVVLCFAFYHRFPPLPTA